ncbi:MAG: tRNA pseudouridine(38-40) synthase TruA [Acidimicrobiia bacterium]
MPTYRLDLSYDGSGFHGYARQPGVPTIQGELEEALGRLAGGKVATAVAGRTDAGVHARGQVVSFEAEEALDPRRVVAALNGMLGPAIVVTSCAQASDGFHARFSACWRAYRYRVLNAPVPDPLDRHVSWYVAEPLDLPAMERAAAGFVGTHDFTSFCRRAPERSSVREVLEAGWEREGDLLIFFIRARSFCHQMVRSLVAFSVEAGRGRVDPGRVGEVLTARDRAAARGVAPPQGLILWEVGYEP